jgi:DNA replication protein DnaC
MSTEKIASVAKRNLPASSAEDPGIQFPRSSGDCDPDCPECGGVGYYSYAVPVGHAMFGKIERCPNARAKAGLRVVIDPRVGLTAQELAGLRWNMVRGGVNQAGEACQAAQRACVEGYGLVFLYGGFGQGKSLVLKTAVAQAYTSGQRAAYANLAAILDDIRTAYDEQDNKMSGVLQRAGWWTSRDVLAIDEFDKVSHTEWARQLIFQLMDDRYRKALQQQAVTIIASNYQSLDDLPGYLRSRFEDQRFVEKGCLIRMNGTDMRTSMPDFWKY